MLCVSAVQFLRKINHRRAAEFAEGTQSSFPDRVLKLGVNEKLLSKLLLQVPWSHGSSDAAIHGPGAVGVPIRMSIIGCAQTDGIVT